MKPCWGLVAEIQSVGSKTWSSSYLEGKQKIKKDYKKQQQRSVPVACNLRRYKKNTEIKSIPLRIEHRICVFYWAQIRKLHYILVLVWSLLLLEHLSPCLVFLRLGFFFCFSSFAKWFLVPFLNKPFFSKPHLGPPQFALFDTDYWVWDTTCVWTDHELTSIQTKNVFFPLTFQV